MTNCTEKAENASKSCYDFMNLLDKNCGEGPRYCDQYKRDLIKSCTGSKYSQGTKYKLFTSNKKGVNLWSGIMVKKLWTWTVKSMECGKILIHASQLISPYPFFVIAHTTANCFQTVRTGAQIQKKGGVSVMDRLLDFSDYWLMMTSGSCQSFPLPCCFFAT